MTHCLVLFREAKDLTQEQLGERLGNVPGNTVARWERGECVPQKRFREKIEEITGTSEDRIISDCLAAAREREAAE